MLFLIKVWTLRSFIATTVASFACPLYWHWPRLVAWVCTNCSYPFVIFSSIDTTVAVPVLWLAKSISFMSCDCFFYLQTKFVNSVSLIIVSVNLPEMLAWFSKTFLRCQWSSSVANKRFSLGRSMSWGSEGHFEAPVGPGKLHIFTSKKR